MFLFFLYVIIYMVLFFVYMGMLMLMCCWVVEIEEIFIEEREMVKVGKMFLVNI